MCRIIIVIVTALTCAGLANAGASPQGHVDSLSQLFGPATVVFAGEVTSVEQTGQRNGIWYGESVQLETFIAHVSVDREYKGPTGLASTEIKFVRPPETVCSVSKCEM